MENYQIVLNSISESLKPIKINKREARKLFNSGVDIRIGGHDITGEGATWKASQFNKSSFNDLCDYFFRYYCRGKGRFLTIEFYK